MFATAQIWTQYFRSYSFNRMITKINPSCIQDSVRITLTFRRVPATIVAVEKQ